MQMSWNKKPASSYVPWSGDEELYFFWMMRGSFYTLWLSATMENWT